MAAKITKAKSFNMGDFWKLLMTILLTEVVKIFGDCWGYLEKHQVKTAVTTFAKFGLLLFQH